MKQISGRVAGWGLTSSGGKPSPHLKEITLPVISREQCLEESDITFRLYLTDDKFCVGHLNSSSGVCQGRFKGNSSLVKRIKQEK